jgi:hypothetical protein
MNSTNTIPAAFAGLPPTGFCRVKQLIGDKEADPPIPAIFPVCAATLWAKIKYGEWALTPVKLSANITAFRVEEVRALIESFSQEGV